MSCHEETRGRPEGARAKAREAGKKFYSTGKPCKYGHIAKRRTSSGMCSECERTYEYIELAPQTCANKLCGKIFIPRMRKYKKGFTEQSLKDGQLEFCSQQCHREKRKRWFWAEGERTRIATADQNYDHTDGDAHPEEFNWSIEEDTRWYWYLHQCHAKREKPLPFSLWRIEEDGYNSVIGAEYE